MSDHTLTLVRYHDRFTMCASCRSAAHWMVDGTPTCHDHIHVWAAYWTERREQQALTIGGR